MSRKYSTEIEKDLETNLWDCVHDPDAEANTYFSPEFDYHDILDMSLFKAKPSKRFFTDPEIRTI